ncbi:plectin-like [Quillaja saponaria]|uniref:Plectin-like n=1 Tax=Quillaja saponaria TaxID=32244 RepID=A0AAD7LNE1_QUISA|nr:plectin-like [Quillaja saponaria]
MGDFSRNIDVEKLISYSNDLVNVLKDKRDIYNLTQCLEHSKSLGSSCDADLNDVRSLFEDYEKQINVSKQKTEEAKSEVAADADLDRLQKELEEELKKEHLLSEELRVNTNEINDLERQIVSVQEQKKTQNTLEQDELRAQRMLSTYASVTTIIPDLDDQSKISGYIVDRDKRVVEKFEFNPTEMTALDTCNGIWKMINSR